MDRKLLCEIVQRIECVAGIETFLVLTVAALHLTVVPRGIRANQLMPDAQLSSRPLKQSRQLALTAGEAVGKLGTVVRLDTLHLDPAACIPRGQSAQEISRRIGGLLRIGGEEAQARELVDGGVLEQSKLRIRDALARHDRHIHLHALPQTVPESDHTQGWIPAAHIADELQLGLCMLVGVAVRPSGLAGQGCHTTIPALLPEVDVRPALVVLPAGAADAVFLCILH